MLLPMLLGMEMVVSPVGGASDHSLSVAVDEEIGQVSPTSPTVDSAHSPLPGNISCFDASVIDDGVQFY